MRICEITDTEEALLAKKGTEDALAGEADWDYLGTLTSEQERIYFRGYKRGQIEASRNAPRRKIAVPIRAIRARMPAKLTAIPDSDLRQTYLLLRHGHSLDGVQAVAPKDAREAMDELVAALARLAEEIQDTIRIFRTIEVQHPAAFVAGLARPTRLGIHWSLSEELTMAHETARRVLLVADAPIESVDWPETIALTIDGVEGEVRLKQGHPIMLVYTEPDSPGQTAHHMA